MKKIMTLVLVIALTIFAFDMSVYAKSGMLAPELEITATDIDSFKISWNKVSGAKGYELYYSTNGKNYKKLATTNKKTYNHNNLKENTKYYYKVRAYTKAKGKTTYGKYSKIQAKRCSNYLVGVYSPYQAYYVEYGEEKMDMRVYHAFLDGETVKLGGTEYTKGFSLATGGYSGCGAYFNLKGKYSSISFTCAGVDGYDTNSKVQIYADDECVKEFTVEPGDLPQNVTIDIEHASKLKISVIYMNKVYQHKIGFADVKLYK